MQRIFRSAFPVTALGTVLLLSACQTVTSTNLGFAPSAVATYDCEDRTVEARYAGNQLRLETGDASYRLRRAPAASGARYTTADDDRQVVFWDKGESALLQVGEAEQEQCTRRNLRSALAGLPFEARGNEPGWQVTVSDARIRLESDYGKNTVTVPRTTARLRPDGYLYAGRTEAHTVNVYVKDGTCRGDMAGRAYPASVRIESDGETLRGCGGERGALLVGKPWQVQTLEGEPIEGEAGPSLHFAADGRLSGTTSCNRYSTSYTLANGFRTGAIAATRKACKTALMQQGQRFLQLLGRVERVEITPQGELRLMTPAGTAMVARQGSSE